MRGFLAILIGINAVLLCIAYFGRGWLERMRIWGKFAIFALASTLVGFCILIAVLVYAPIGLI